MNTKTNKTMSETKEYVMKNSAKNIELEINEPNCLVAEGVGIKVNSGYLDTPNFIRMFNTAGNGINPRSAVKNPIVEEIVCGLYETPMMFPFKSKGLTVGTTRCEKTQEGKYNMVFVQSSAVAADSLQAGMPDVDARFAGILDGAHTALALASYIYGVLYNKPCFIFKNWEEAKNYYKQHYMDIMERYVLLNGECKEKLSLRIPVQIVSPIDETSEVSYKKQLPSICSGRNKSAQLSVTTLASHSGIYDYLKEVFDSQFNVIWKDGDTSMKKSESIHSADIVKTTVIPFAFLSKLKKLDNMTASVDKKSFYTSKAKCLKLFGEIAQNENYFVMNEGDVYPTLASSRIKSAIDMAKDIAIYADRLYAEFPTLFNRSGRRLGLLSCVEQKDNKAYPYKTLDKKVQYKYPTSFIAPLVAGVTELMRYNPDTDRLEWIVNPASNAFKINELDIRSLVNRYKELNDQPNDCGKTASCYDIADAIYRDYLVRNPLTGVKVA